MQAHFRTPDIPGTLVEPEHAHHLRELVASLCRVEHTRFPGSQPVSFKKLDIERLHKADYWVCEKSDGIRVLMLIVPVQAGQEICLIDRKNAYRIVPNLYFPHYGDKTRPLGHTLLDGELVLDVDAVSKHETLRFLAFDCLVCDGTNVMDRILEKRYGRLMNFVIAPHQNMLRELPDMARNRPFDIEEDIPRLKHGTDGLIYTCVDTPYVVGTDSNLLKWKEPSQNSVDFKSELRFPPSPNRPQEPDYAAKPVFLLNAFHGERRGAAHYEYFDIMEVDDVTWDKMKTTGEQYDDRIVEVAWDMKTQNWTFLRFRDDKTDGNHISVIQNILESIRDGVESPERRDRQLISCAAAVKVAWKARASAKSSMQHPPPPPPPPPPVLPPSSNGRPNDHTGPIYSRVGGPLKAGGFVR
ncbi:mRNA capping enzyme, catalytic domain-containing protein [Cantharellus anzutake]|uniref:mRNA capping enzyme, catalytic domain-containing protein n=1 Tax=Cantharellus anzutake TaxID=1750568 RepID=UPI00190655CA|nr:mRNA capping enzyme, catalytic domain-containing protein [Cantharellus anzutake]KAF8344169.1 mRNA capping enzyme, catalytic domain-containing protein [Cantharellus anzutake]